MSPVASTSSLTAGSNPLANGVGYGVEPLHGAIAPGCRAHQPSLLVDIAPGADAVDHDNLLLAGYFIDDTHLADAQAE